MEQRKIELLAPARNLECGIEAVNHGADAVYIGASRFGARAAAFNSVEDIGKLTDYAHLYGARVYVTVNTILKEEELSEAESLIWEVYRAGADALIVQDMGLLKLDLPPIPFHASTQMDNRDAERLRFLAEVGFSRAVLARELTLEEIAHLHAACPVELEAFVHGALCVSYSGQCYASQACFGRSANRGECAQFCRLPFTMEDAEGRVMARSKHLLSLKDLNLGDSLEALLDAGVTSLKIEGRLKELSYVKNVTAWYRQRLDVLFERRKEYVPSSSGRVELRFRPNPVKSFNRGFTHYFLYGRGEDIGAFDTPKSIGEEMGMVKEVRGRCLTVAGVKSFHNGDGVCYKDASGRLQGFRVNRVENNKLFLQEESRVPIRSMLYRNFDNEFEKVLTNKSARRLIVLRVRLGECAFGFTVEASDEEENRVVLSFPAAKVQAHTPQTENLCVQFGKLGGTPFVLSELSVEWSDDWFVPSSVLAEWRRFVVERLLLVRRLAFHRFVRRPVKTVPRYPTEGLTYLGNVMNTQAEAFYREHGVCRIDPAFERRHSGREALMCCKHCLRYSMNLCTDHGHMRSPYREPFFLVSADGKRFRLEFDCRHCQMKVYGTDD